jgi:aminoglycoside phosphotransferase (APT) family kinase protein
LPLFGQAGRLKRVDVARIAADLLELDAQPVVRPTSSPVAHFLDLPDRTVVAKLPAVGRPGSALVEAWAYREAATHSVRVPDVLAISEEPELVLLELLPGESLWSRRGPVEATAPAWRAAGADLRVLHEIRVSGFGPLTVREGKLQGEAAGWSPFVTFAREQGLARLADLGYLQSDEVEPLQRRYAEAAPLMICPDGRLLHGDLEGGHVLVDASDAYQGTLDFGQAQAGDPRWDLARVRLWDGNAALDAVLDGYGRDAITADERDVLLPLYLLAFVVHHAAAGIGDDVSREMLTLCGYRRLL